MWIYNPETELYHYGVKGMKWGVRKKRPISSFQSKRNATKAANEARKKSIAESRASGDTGLGSFHRANRKALNAKRKAYGESIQRDRVYNKQLRAERKAVKEQAREDHRKSLNKYYSNSKDGGLMYAVDRYNYGKKGVERISKRMDKGMSNFAATTIESGRIAGLTALSTVGTIAAVGLAASVIEKKR